MSSISDVLQGDLVSCPASSLQNLWVARHRPDGKKSGEIGARREANRSQVEHLARIGPPALGILGAGSCGDPSRAFRKEPAVRRGRRVWRHVLRLCSRSPSCARPMWVHGHTACQWITVSRGVPQGEWWRTRAVIGAASQSSSSTRRLSSRYEMRLMSIAGLSVKQRAALPRPPRPLGEGWGEGNGQGDKSVS